MSQQMSTSSFHPANYCESDHTALQVAPCDGRGELYPQTPLQAQAMDLSICSDGLQHYVPDDTTLQVTPYEKSRWQSAPELFFSRVGKEVFRGGNKKEGLRSGTSSTVSETVKRSKLRRRLKIMASLLGVIAVIIVVVAVPITETRQSRAAHSPVGITIPSGSQSPDSAGKPLVKHDPTIGTPITLSQLVHNSISQSSALGPGSALFYQAVDGSVMITEREGDSEDTWTVLRIVLTDAVNNTGLASFSYLNGSVSQASIFYIDGNGYVQEQRSYSSFSAWSSLSTIDSMNLLPATPSGPTNSDVGLSSLGEDYRLAAAHSTAFSNGPQGHVFYNSRAANGSYYIQEVIWGQDDNFYVYGSMFTDAAPGSHLATVVDEVTRTLHLFYSTHDLTLQEAWLNMSDPFATYQKGVSFPNLLISDSADFAAIFTGGSTFLYYFSASDQSFHEINITAAQQSFPNDPSQNSTVWYDLSSFPTIAQPVLSAKDNKTALYQPVGAAVLNVSASGLEVCVFWAEGIVASDSGYTALRGTSRPIGGSWDPSLQGQVSLQLSP